MAGFTSRWDSGTTDYIEKVANNIVEEVLTLGRGGDYDLIVVGKGRFPSKMVAELADRHAENPELGPIGDILASPGQGLGCSVLVIQQHDLEHTEEVACSVSKVFQSSASNTTMREISRDIV